MTKEIKITVAGQTISVPIPDGLRAGTREYMKGIRFAEKIEIPESKEGKRNEAAIERFTSKTPPAIIQRTVALAIPRHPLLRLSEKLISLGLAKAGIERKAIVSHDIHAKFRAFAKSNNPFWAGVVAVGDVLGQTVEDPEEHTSKEWVRLANKAIEQVGYDGQNETSKFKKKLAQLKARKKVFGEERTMDLKSINGLLTRVIGHLQESELNAILQESTPRFSPNEHDEPTKDELEKHIVATIYKSIKKGWPSVSFQAMHMESRPLFGEMFSRRYKGIVTKAINRLRRRDIIKMDDHSHRVEYLLTPGGIQAAKTGNMKKVKKSVSSKRQEEIDKITLMKFILEYMYENKNDQGFHTHQFTIATQNQFRGEDLANMLSHLEQTINELQRSEYIEEKWTSVSKFTAEHRWFLTPKGSRARVQMKIPGF